MGYNFEIGKVYTFNTNAPAILGTTIKNAKLTSILDFDSARRYDEVLFKYRSIFPLLPVGTPDQPDSCVYYKFKGENGSDIILADQWINEPTVELITAINIRLTITDISTLDISRIRDVLLALGYQNFNIEQF